MNSSSILTPLAAVLLLTSVAPSPAQERTNSFRGGPPRPRIVSPEISADRKITFRVQAAKAEKVQLGPGDLQGLGQGPEMRKGSNDVWEVTVGPVKPGAYRYNFNL